MWRRCGNYDSVVQVGFGKSGTTTVKKFFTGDRYDYNASCFHVSQIVSSLRADYTRPMHVTRAACPQFYVSELAAMYHPDDNYQFQLTHLPSIQRELGARTLFVHCRRNTSRWVDSVRAWNNLAQRYTTRDVVGLPEGRGGSESDLVAWYDNANAYIGFVFLNRPNYVRVNVDQPDTLQRLARVCGVQDVLTFGVHNANPVARLVLSRRRPAGRAQRRARGSWQTGQTPPT